MSWGLQVVEGEEMAQGVQPEGQNVVVPVAEGVGRPVPPSCTRLTMTIRQTCRYHLGGLEQDLGKASGRQPLGCFLFAWLQGRRGLELKEYLEANSTEIQMTVFQKITRDIPATPITQKGISVRRLAHQPSLEPPRSPHCPFGKGSMGTNQVQLYSLRLTGMQS